MEQIQNIDAHSHLNFDQFDDDRKKIITDMKEQKIGAINVGIDAQTSRESVRLAQDHDHIWASVGCHPSEANENFTIENYHNLITKEEASEASYNSSLKINSQNGVVAVGECGLDYSRSEYRANKDWQEDAFTAQIKLAAQKNLPLILHIRPQENSMDAYERGLDILEHFQNQIDGSLTGTAHFFVGSKKIAKQFLECGFYISFTGPITYETRLQDVCGYIPEDRLLAETDSPFAPPQTTQEDRNTPLEVPKVVQAIAEAKEGSVDSMAEQLVTNTARLFTLTSVEKQVNL